MRRDYAKKPCRWVKALPKEKILAITVPIMIVAVAVIGALNIHLIPAFNLVLLAGLIAVTTIYASSTIQIARDTKRQADEIREQRIMTSRPLLIQKSVNDDQFSHFEIYNAGNGTAIEVQVILLDQWEKTLDGKREGFLRSGDTPINFYTNIPPAVGDSTFYIVSEYQGILTHSSKPTWYQTKLPCKLSVSGKVIDGKLQFLEVPQEKRIGIFSSEFNNQRKPK